MLNKKNILGFILTIVSTTSIASIVNTMAMNPNQNQYSNDGSYSWMQESVGNQFTVNEEIAVTALGIWDYQADGLANDYNVILFDDVGSVLATTDVFSGTQSRLEDGSRWADLIAPVNLSMNTTYTVATYRPNLDDIFQWVEHSSVDIASEINLLTGVYAGGSTGNGYTTKFATGILPRDGVFGANLQFETINTPVPAAVWLFGTGLMGLISVKKRKKIS